MAKPILTKKSLILDAFLPYWHDQLQQWSLSGRLTAAAKEALMLQGEPKALKELTTQWSAGDFRDIPSIALLSNSDINGALGAYAISTGKIYLNADCLKTATQDAVNAVLTEELGHYLDCKLNQKDTQGDEGEYFSDLLRGVLLTDSQKAGLTTEDDTGSIKVDGFVLQAEFAASAPAVTNNTIATQSNSNLALFPFTDLADRASSNTGFLIGSVEPDGLITTPIVVVNTFAGDDVITGIGTATGNSIENRGIYNFGTIDTGADNDTITGIGNGGNADGIRNFGTIDTGTGNDTIKGIGNGGGNGIINFGYGTIIGTINTGDGADTIIGTSITTSDNRPGIENYGVINTGGGDDSITGESNNTFVKTLNSGIQNNGIINTGTGNDTITGTGSVQGIDNQIGGIIKTGEGNDTIIGKRNNENLNYTSSGAEISNSGTIDTGAGYDTIAGTLIANRGTIDTGADDDIIDLHRYWQRHPHRQNLQLQGLHD